MDLRWRRNTRRIHRRGRRELSRRGTRRLQQLQLQAGQPISHQRIWRGREQEPLRELDDQPGSDAKLPIQQPPEAERTLQLQSGEHQREVLYPPQRRAPLLRVERQRLLRKRGTLDGCQAELPDERHPTGLVIQHSALITQHLRRRPLQLGGLHTDFTAGLQHDERQDARHQLDARQRQAVGCVQQLEGHRMVRAGTVQLPAALLPAAERSDGDLLALWPRCRPFGEALRSSLGILPRRTGCLGGQQRTVVPVTQHSTLNPQLPTPLRRLRRQR